jgi:hypothetical protein
MPVHVPPRGGPADTPQIVDETPTHVTIEWEVSRAEPGRHQPFLRMLLDAATPPPGNE